MIIFRSFGVPFELCTPLATAGPGHDETIKPKRLCIQWRRQDLVREARNYKTVILLDRQPHRVECQNLCGSGDLKN